MRLDRLTERDLLKWQSRLPSAKATTLKRCAGDLKAALNLAFAKYRRVLPADVPIIIRFGLTITAEDNAAAICRGNQILSDEEVRRLIAAAGVLNNDGDFGCFVLLLAARGARFSQIARMQVKDVLVDQCRLMIPKSRKGGWKQPGYIRLPIGADVDSGFGASPARSAIGTHPP